MQRRVEVIGPDSEILPGSIILFRWAPVASGVADSGGAWFETQREFNFGATLFGVKKERGLQIHEYFDFRRFQAESTITVDEPK